MKADRLLLLTPLREALERIGRKAEPLSRIPLCWITRMAKIVWM